MRLELPSRLPRRTVIEGPSKIHRKQASMGFSGPIEAPSRILLDGHSCLADDINRQLATRGFFHISLRYASGAPSNVIVGQQRESCVTSHAHKKTGLGQIAGPSRVATHRNRMPESIKIRSVARVDAHWKPCLETRIHCIHDAGGGASTGCREPPPGGLGRRNKDNHRASGPVCI